MNEGTGYLLDTDNAVDECMYEGLGTGMNDEQGRCARYHFSTRQYASSINRLWSFSQFKFVHLA